MGKQVWIVLASIVLTACAGQQHTLSNGVIAADRAVTFTDMRRFDQEVAAAMRGQAPAVTVTFLAPTTVNQIPERLGTWFTMIEEYQGTVALQRDPEERTRGMITEVLSLLWTAYKAIENRLLYSPAGQYNATIYHASNGTISRVVFTRKS